MSWRNYRPSCLGIAVFIVACMTCDPPGVHADEERAAKRPNLLFIFADQMRGSAMGFLGEEPVVTPNLDRLATEAIVFTEAPISRDRDQRYGSEVEAVKARLGSVNGVSDTEFGGRAE